MSKQIKVIKKSAQQKEVAVSNSVRMTEIKQKANSTKSAAREMASTVTSWVNEFQQKRREETTNALKQLFREQPQPTGA